MANKFLTHEQVLEIFIDGLRSSITGVPSTNLSRDRIDEKFTQNGADAHWNDEYAIRKVGVELGALLPPSPVFGELPGGKYFKTKTITIDGICARVCQFNNPLIARLDVLFRSK